jgi:hypothetical protein
MWPSACAGDYRQSETLDRTLEVIGPADELLTQFPQLLCISIVVCVLAGQVVDLVLDNKRGMLGSERGAQCSVENHASSLLQRHHVLRWQPFSFVALDGKCECFAEVHLVESNDHIIVVGAVSNT